MHSLWKELVKVSGKPAHNHQKLSALSTKHLVLGSLPGHLYKNCALLMYSLYTSLDGIFLSVNFELSLLSTVPITTTTIYKGDK